MKILLIITGLGLGGAEVQVTGLADRFAVLGHKVSIVYLTGPIKVAPASNEIEIIGLGIEKSLTGFVRAFLKLRSYVRNLQPDVVHSHMVHANLLARAVGLTTKIALLVNTAHNTYEGGRIRMLAYRVTDKVAHVFSNVTDEAVVAFERNGAVPLNRMIRMSNGIDTDVFIPNTAAREKLRSIMDVRQSQKVILAVGRFVEAKDYPNLLQAFKLVSGVDESSVLWIAGDGPLRSQLEKMVFVLNLNRRVKFLGERRDVNELMNAADVFALASAWEGFGLVVAEAMACEKLVVATDCGGVGEVLDNHGFLVEKRSPREFAKELLKALNIEDEEKNKIVTAARSSILKRFSMSQITEDWLQIYRLEKEKL